MTMTITFYVLSFLGLLISMLKSKEKTILALKKAWKSFENLMPQLVAILFLIGFVLAIVTPDQISSIIGSGTGVWGTLTAAVMGSVTLIPGFVAFPLAEALLKNGAGYMQIAAFISTLMMVGIVTYPIEKQYFGKKATILRNSLAFVFSLIVALAMGVIL